MAKNTQFFNTLMGKARANREYRAHKWYDAPVPAATKTETELSSSSGKPQLPVGGGTAGGMNYATGTVDPSSPTSYGVGRGTFVDYYTKQEYSGGPFNYQDAPVDFKTGEPLGSPFVDSDFVRDESGQIRTVTQAEIERNQALTQYSQAAPLERVTSAEAALAAPVGSVGTSNPVALDLIDFLAGGTGFATAFLGDVVVGARGKETATGSGVPGQFGREKIKKDYEVFEAIKEGKPGYHQFYMGSQLVSIAPTPENMFTKGMSAIGLPVSEYTAYGNIDIETAKQVIGGAKGIDPRTIDFSKSMADEAFGERLAGFIPDVGGLTKDFGFVDASGKFSASVPNLSTYAGLLATKYGNKNAAVGLNQLAQASGNKKVAELATLAAQGKLSARSYKDDNGQTIGFETPTGGYVTNNDGEPVKTGSGGYATWGTGPASAEAVLGDRIGDLSGDSGLGIGDFSYTPSGFKNVSGSDGVNLSTEAKVATKQGETFFGGGDNEGPSGAGTSKGESASDLEGTGYGGVGYSSPFAHGGRVGKQEGGTAVAPSGFIEKPTDQVSEEESVADNVPMDVEEGAFIVNAAAIEHMGLADFQKMITDAVEKAKELGIDIPETSGKMGEGEVPLAVSRGEGYISKALAKIIGYDKLNKINNRGKKEVAQRQEESEQALQDSKQTDAQGMAMAPGGVARTLDDRVNDVDEMLDNRFADFRDRLDMLNQLYNRGSLKEGPEFDKAYNKARKKYQDDVREVAAYDKEAFEVIRGRQEEKYVGMLNEMEFSDPVIPGDEEIRSHASMISTIPFGSDNSKFLHSRKGNRNFGFTVPTVGDREAFIAGGGDRGAVDVADIAEHEAFHDLTDGASFANRRGQKYNSELSTRALDYLRAMLGGDKEQHDYVKKQLDMISPVHTSRLLGLGIDVIKDLYNRGIFDVSKADSEKAERVLAKAEELDKTYQELNTPIEGADAATGATISSNPRFQVGKDYVIEDFDSEELRDLLDILPFSTRRPGSYSPSESRSKHFDVYEIDREAINRSRSKNNGGFISKPK